MRFEAANKHQNQPLVGGLSNNAFFIVQGVAAGGVLLLLATGIEWVLFEPGYYSTLDLHPFWIVVVLASFHGGLAVGVVTAALAGLMMDWSRLTTVMDVPYVPVLPLQWLLAALCLGIFRQADMRRHQRLQHENRTLFETNEKLAAELVITDDALDRAQISVATRRFDSSFAVEVLDGIVGLETSARCDVDADVKSLANRCTSLEAEVLWCGKKGKLPMDASVLHAVQASDTADQIPQLLKSSIQTRRAVTLVCDTSEGDPIHLLVAGFQGTKSKAPAGAIVFLAHTAEEAASVRPVADLLSRAVSLALTHTAATKDTDKHQTEDATSLHPPHRATHEHV